eukprot:2192033-Amphidinium_carterae.1
MLLEPGCMPILALPTGAGKTTAGAAIVAMDLEGLVVAVLPNATQCEATAKFMKTTPADVANEGQVSFSAQTAYVHPSQDEARLRKSRVLPQ